MTPTHFLRCAYCKWISVTKHPDRCDAAMRIHEQYAHKPWVFTIGDVTKIKNRRD